MADKEPNKNGITDDQMVEIANLARDILENVRINLVVFARYMDQAINRITLIVHDKELAATDGEYYFYNPMTVISDYSKSEYLPVRQYFHSVLHCVFRHMYVGILENERYWDLACDIQVESVINEFTDLDNIVQNDNTAEQKLQARKLKKEGDLPLLSAEIIYHYFCEHKPSEKRLLELEYLFSQDDHTVWYDREEYLGGNDPNREASKYGDPDDDSNLAKNEYWRNKIIEQREAQKRMWEDISRTIQTAREEFDRRRGNEPGLFSMSVDALNREKYDYSSFLKKFAVMHEAMKVSDDEFDYVYYTYGLQLYGNVPLIEPLEYREIKRVKDFVIAIDTSGSTSPIVRAFLNKTYSILKSTESFFTKFNIYIIQCDTRITDICHVESQEQFDEYVKTLQIKGFGGTDFRPVFNYVDELVESGELSNLKGMVYFTDCDGPFPEVPPSYITALVNIDHGCPPSYIPRWATYINLEEEELDI